MIEYEYQRAVMPPPGQRTRVLNNSYGKDGWELCAEADGLFTFKRAKKALTPEEHAIKALAIESIPTRRAYLNDLKPEMKALVKAAMEGIRRCGEDEARAEAQKRFDAEAAITENTPDRDARHRRNIAAYLQDHLRTRRHLFSIEQAQQLQGWITSLSEPSNFSRTQRKVLENIRNWVGTQLAVCPGNYTPALQSSFKVWHVVLGSILKRKLGEGEEAPGWAKDDASCRHCGKPVFEVTDQPSGRKSWRHRSPGGYYYWCEADGPGHFAEPQPREAVIHPVTFKAAGGAPRLCQHCNAKIFELTDHQGKKTWIHEDFVHTGCQWQGQKMAEPKILKPWTGDMPLGAFCSTLVPVWVRLAPETRKDLWDAITAFEGGEDLLKTAGLRL